jgi:hypothetical protein
LDKERLDTPITNCYVVNKSRCPVFIASEVSGSRNIEVIVLRLPSPAREGLSSLSNALRRKYMELAVEAVGTVGNSEWSGLRVFQALWEGVGKSLFDFSRRFHRAAVSTAFRPREKCAASLLDAESATA